MAHRPLAQRRSSPPPTDARQPQCSDKDVLLISHANPEDNEFTRWLALRLASHGYKVWADIIKLIGGERFWGDIESTMRDRAVKVLYVLSKTSNENGERGFTKELHLADALRKKYAASIPHFIVPLAIDDLRPSDYNVYLNGLNSINFFESWATGLDALLKRLRKDGVPRFRNQTENVAGQWWRNFRSAWAGLKREPETFLSNWFRIEGLPDCVQIVLLKHDLDEKHFSIDFDYPYPVVQNGNTAYSLAPSEDFDDKLGPHISLVSSEAISLTDLFKPRAERTQQTEFLRIALVRLLNLTWEHAMEEREDLLQYEMANGRKCFYFKKPEDQDTIKAFYRDVKGEQAWRNLIGTHTRKIGGDPNKTKTIYWHLGFSAEAMLYPEPTYRISSHVIFTVDGNAPLSSPRAMHTARRRVCKNWYNDRWRDLMLAGTAFMSGDEDYMSLAYSSTERLRISRLPITIDSKLHFVQVKQTIPASVDEEAVEADDETLAEDEFSDDEDFE